MMPPSRKKEMMVSLSMIRFFIAAGIFLGAEANIDKSMPRSVNIPVRCVVLTTEPEITETRAFCMPIAKSRLPAKYSVSGSVWL